MVKRIQNPCGVEIWPWVPGGASTAALVAAVSGSVEVARTSATVEEKGECVQQFLQSPMGSPNTYELVGLECSAQNGVSAADLGKAPTS